MCTDLLKLYCSYLPIEQIFIVCKDKLLDDIIKIYKLSVPCMDYSCKNGFMNIVKYLYKKGIKPNSNSIDLASHNGHLEIVKFLFMNDIEPTYIAIYKSSENGHFEVVKYL